MKYLLFLLALPAFAQTSLTIRVVDNGVEQVAKVSGPAAAQGLEVLKQWLAKQTVCTQVAEVPAIITNNIVTTPAVPGYQDCKPKYLNVADFIKQLTLDVTERFAPEFPSSAIKPDVDEVKAKQAIVDAKRKALFDAARAEKP